MAELLPSAIPVPARRPAVPPAGADNGAAWCRSPGGIHCLRNRSDIARADLEPVSGTGALRTLGRRRQSRAEEPACLAGRVDAVAASRRPRWAWEDQPPGSLMLGFDPQTGPGHEPDYFAPEALA